MLLIVFAATEKEIAPFRKWLKDVSFNDGRVSVDCIITGPGILSSCYSITTGILQKKPSWAIQAGIGGTLSERFSPGDSVLIQDEMIGDIGVQETGSYIDAFDLGLLESDRFPFEAKRLPNPSISHWRGLQLPTAHGVTVNQITTDISAITRYRDKFNLEVESMEGASLHFAASMLQTPFLQIRSISNKVGERDKKKWKTHEAIAALNENLIQLIKNV